MSLAARLAQGCLLVVGLGCSPSGAKPSSPARSCLSPVGAWVTRLKTAEAARDEACRSKARLAPQGRSVRDIACEPAVAGRPVASSEQGDDLALRAVDGNASTAWRGEPGEQRWEWTLPLRRVVRLGLIRAWFGDDPIHGVPAAYRWEVQAQCDPSAPWTVAPDGSVDDRHPNEFVHGPKNVHAQKQVYFPDIDACALRLVVLAVDGGAPPVVRELEVYESARSLALEPGVEVSGTSAPGLPRASARGAVDGRYETFWAGERGAGAWTLEVRLPQPRVVDRIALMLGYDAVTVQRKNATGRSFAGAQLPMRYSIEVSGEGEPARWERVHEADPPMALGEPMPVRRRLIHLEFPKPVQRVRLSITQATGPWGERDPALAAPVVRELGLYGANDARPVIAPPLFLSVNANPSGLTRESPHGEAYVDGGFARDAYSRLRRIVVGFDADTRWPADASRARDDGTGRFLEAIEGDDAWLDRGLLVENAPPPVVMLSGGMNWDLGERTARAGQRAWTWNVLAPASSIDRGMGQLASSVRDRVAPFLGFCGGGQILAMLEASAALDGVGLTAPQDLYPYLMLRNTNVPISGVASDKRILELAWWFDPPAADARRPLIAFDPADALFDTWRLRASSRALPSSHYNMLRMTAFSSLLEGFVVSAWSEFCRPWVNPSGPEPTSSRGADVCVRIPQAFRSRDRDQFPVIGFQFHPEQRDFPRLAPGAPEDERGDGLNVFANAIDLAIASYLRVWWPGA